MGDTDTPPRQDFVIQRAQPGWKTFSDDQKRAYLARVKDRTEGERTDWHSKARPTQLIVFGDEAYVLILAGRGWGKTAVGSQTLRDRVRKGLTREGGLVGATAADVRDTMVEGPAGVLRSCPRWERPLYQPSNRRLVWPNGAITHTYSAEEPDRLRGPGLDYLWGDEVAAWKRLKDALDQIGFVVREGKDPKVLLTTTGKPRPELRKLRRDAMVRVIRGSSYENLDNLAPLFKATILRHEGTRLGQQELYGDVLDDVEGAYWNPDWYDREGFRVDLVQVPDLRQVVVAVDPAATSKSESDLSGVVVAGIAFDGTVYILHSEGVRLSPRSMMRRVATLYYLFKGDRVIFEANNGGDYLPALLETVDDKIPHRNVTASRGKLTRAEPVSSLYERKKPRLFVHHVRPDPSLHRIARSDLWTPEMGYDAEVVVDGHGMTVDPESGLVVPTAAAGPVNGHDLLEEQQTSYTGLPGEESPDVMDAGVWAVWALAIEPESEAASEEYEDTRQRGRR